MTPISQDVFPALIVMATPESSSEAGDLSPTSVKRDDGQYQINTARIIITQDRVMIARDSSDGPVLIFSEAIDPADHYKNPDRAGISYVTTRSGKKIAFLKDTTCGCGSRLKTWRPYKFATSSKDPV